MRIPLILAHGELLPGAVFSIALAFSFGLVCLMFAYRFEMRKTPEGRKTARRLLVVAGIVCIAILLLGPPVAKILLPLR